MTSFELIGLFEVVFALCERTLGCCWLILVYFQNLTQYIHLSFPLLHKTNESRHVPAISVVKNCVTDLSALDNGVACK